MQAPPHPSARAMTIVVQVGTVLSTALLAIGLVLAVVEPGSTAASTLLTAGILILLGTPVSNLVIAIIDEIVAKEWGFTALGVAVILLLCGSVFVAFSG